MRDDGSWTRLDSSASHSPVAAAITAFSFEKLPPQDWIQRSDPVAAITDKSSKEAPKRNSYCVDNQWWISCVRAPHVDFEVWRTVTIVPDT